MTSWMHPLGRAARRWTNQRADDVSISFSANEQAFFCFFGLLSFAMLFFVLHYMPWVLDFFCHLFIICDVNGVAAKSFLIIGSRWFSEMVFASKKEFLFCACVYAKVPRVCFLSSQLVTNFWGFTLCTILSPV
ncbi:hypothetical protein BO85DRAFT_194810 [Aspergillus piperis CBS 112811]|uniref:Uncharacterized protein n=1 Tax=Aspergillus piperis CBS 112811 TaxID=1448313 RepID=A0A8G1VT13_9EURO|nr:hypothetical protein BO85DRAFT_194810 [Aspergillus piperis CBS 112811]RAH61358.1 hypothetical protein BO85DRAFT_194810 [Aspergillus piperis CBS 112811]